MDKCLGNALLKQLIVRCLSYCAVKPKSQPKMASCQREILTFSTKPGSRCSLGITRVKVFNFSGRALQHGRMCNEGCRAVRCLVSVVAFCNRSPRFSFQFLGFFSFVQGKTVKRFMLSRGGFFKNLASWHFEPMLKSLLWMAQESHVCSVDCFFSCLLFLLSLFLSGCQEKV